MISSYTKFVTASEVAEAIYWLESEKSSFVTGSFIDIAGGM
jgi:NAD(P)-dependent dehydrogenase (short-subunit alcohol dehydrogenase family)